MGTLASPLVGKALVKSPLVPLKGRWVGTLASPVGRGRANVHQPTRRAESPPPLVILSAAKHLGPTSEILSAAKDDTGEISMTILSLITIHRLTCIIRNACAARPNSITLIHEGRPEGE